MRSGWLDRGAGPEVTNIRDAPGLHSKVMAAAPFSKDPEQEMRLNIIRHSNGWLKVKAAADVEGTFSWPGISWISAKKIEVGIEVKSGARSAPLHASPNKSSRKIGQVPDPANFLIVGFDCFGLKVTYRGQTGWLSRNDLCGNPLPTCS